MYTFSFSYSYYLADRLNTVMEPLQKAIWEKCVCLLWYSRAGEWFGAGRQLCSTGSSRTRGPFSLSSVLQMFPHLHAAAHSQVPRPYIPAHVTMRNQNFFKIILQYWCASLGSHFSAQNFYASLKALWKMWPL